MEKLKVGIATLGYNERRNIADLPFEKYVVEKRQNLHKIPAWLYFKFKNTTHLRHWNSFRDFDLGDTSLYHLFNGISFGKKPWFVTFETFLPRWGTQSEKHLRKGLDALAGSACRQMIGFSAYTVAIQKAWLEEHFPAYLSVLEPKLSLLHPQQVPKIGNYQEKTLSPDRVNLCMVGSAFYRKGGTEVLKAVDRLLTEGRNELHLTIVSRMELDFFSRYVDQEEVDMCQRLIAKHPDNIHHHRSLQNTEVLALFKKSHIGLLPSYQDTFGYSVLEAQACGCPVISTDIRALPEINNEDCGWLVEIPKDSYGNAQFSEAKKKRKTSEQMEAGLYVILSRILDDPNQIAQKGKASLERIRQAHAPASRASFLEKQYDLARIQ